MLTVIEVQYFQPNKAFREFGDKWQCVSIYFHLVKMLWYISPSYLGRSRFSHENFNFSSSVDPLFFTKNNANTTNNSPYGMTNLILHRIFFYLSYNQNSIALLAILKGTVRIFEEIIRSFQFTVPSVHWLTGYCSKLFIPLLFPSVLNSLDDIPKAVWCYLCIFGGAKLPHLTCVVRHNFWNKWQRQIFYLYTVIQLGVKCLW